MQTRRLTSRYYGGTLQDGKVGVIDIGSNSVRLVVYDRVKRVPFAIYNDKAFCALARGLSQTNRLNPEGVRSARRAMARFLASVKLMEVAELFIIATAAVRDADDGKTFVKELERTHGVTIQIIPGKREAQLAAYGIFSSHWEAKGLAGDLGGGSLEVIGLHDTDIDMFDSLPIGPLRLLDQVGEDRDRLRHMISAKLDKVKWLEGLDAAHFYAIGGSFRSLGKVHMERTAHPLPLLHDYEVASEELLPVLDEIAEWPEKKMKDLPVTGKRQPQMPAAAMIFRELLRRSGAKTVVFSTSGVREGLLFDQLSPFIRKEDPLLSSALEMSEQNGRHPAYAGELFDWSTPFFPGENAVEERLRLAACILNEIAWRIYRPARGEWAYHWVIQSSLVAMSHTERVMLAAALYHRYRPDWKHHTKSYSLLNDRQIAWAKAVGAMLSMGYYLSGALPGNLGHAAIRMEHGNPQTPPLQRRPTAGRRKLRQTPGHPNPQRHGLPSQQIITPTVTNNASWSEKGCGSTSTRTSNPGVAKHKSTMRFCRWKVNVGCAGLLASRNRPSPTSGSNSSTPPRILKSPSSSVGISGRSSTHRRSWANCRARTNRLSE